MHNRIPVAVIIALALCILAAGCTSGWGDIARASQYMESGKNTLDRTDVTNGSFAETEANLDSAEQDYRQALALLLAVNATGDREKEIVLLDTAACRYNLNQIDAGRNLSAFSYHMKMTQAAIGAKDFAGAHREIALGRLALENTSASLAAADQVARGIDTGNVSAENRDAVARLTAPGKYAGLVGDFQVLLTGFDHLVSANEDLNKAAMYAKNRNLSMVKVHASLAKTELQKAKDTFDSLKGSRNPDVSLAATKISGTLGTYIDQINSFL